MKGLQWPKRMPSDAVLYKLLHPPPPAAYLPRVTPQGTRAPLISKRMAQQLREAALLLELDPVKLGIPMETVEEREVVVPQGHQRLLARQARASKIQGNMAQMPQRLAQWKEDKRKAVEASKPDMPF